MREWGEVARMLATVLAGAAADNKGQGRSFLKAKGQRGAFSTGSGSSTRLQGRGLLLSYRCYCCCRERERRGVGWVGRCRCINSGSASAWMGALPLLRCRPWGGHQMRCPHCTPPIESTQIYIYIYTVAWQVPVQALIKYRLPTTCLTPVAQQTSGFDASRQEGLGGGEHFRKEQRELHMVNADGKSLKRCGHSIITRFYVLKLISWAIGHGMSRRHQQPPNPVESNLRYAAKHFIGRRVSYES